MHLPLELLQKVSDYLSISEYLKLKSTAKRLCGNADDYYGRYYPTIEWQFLICLKYSKHKIIRNILTHKLMQPQRLLFEPDHLDQNIRSLSLVRQVDCDEDDAESVASVMLSDCGDYFSEYEDQGLTCVEIACLNQSQETLRVLLEDGRTDPAENDQGSLRLALQGDDPELVRILLNDPRVDPTFEDGYAFHLAANPEIVALLLLDGRVPLDQMQRKSLLMDLREWSILLEDDPVKALHMMQFSDHFKYCCQWLSIRFS
ncbi:hypothetical protein EDD86DRAFT_249528 [Gorgonomyces haynaldii]|nr:hypothetical protein EDD86DRAFT_249528 [Gorgonomyces haynaldii]